MKEELLSVVPACLPATMPQSQGGLLSYETSSPNKLFLLLLLKPQKGQVDNIESLCTEVHCNSHTPPTSGCGLDLGPHAAQ
ncbi:hypothetical protein STEG23_024580, partial [Scotinomys teguina]